MNTQFWWLTLITCHAKKVVGPIKKSPRKLWRLKLTIIVNKTANIGQIKMIL